MGYPKIFGFSGTGVKQGVSSFFDILDDFSKHDFNPLVLHGELPKS